MTLCFAHLCSSAARAERQRTVAAIRAGWAALGQPSSTVESRCVQFLREFDPRLSIEVGDGDLDWVVTYDSVEARGLAELAAAQAGGWSVGVGRPARPVGDVCDRIRRRAGVDVSCARVRAGFTRGHLLEIVVAFPVGCVSSGQSELAEWLVEGVLGEAFVDDWVAAVGTSHLPRTGPLQVLQTDADSPTTYALQELVELASRAVGGVQSLLPEVPRNRLPQGADWTWLEMTPDPQSAQPDRMVAVTCEPELLKCALEGVNFHSRRFSRWEERFVWLSIGAIRGVERLQRRETIEKRLDEALRASGQGAIIGTGFGPEREYFDLCLAAGDDALEAVTALARELGLGCDAKLGFYDTRWAEERVRLG